MVQAGQTGKTDLILDCIGSRADQSPTPMLYVGPTLKMVEQQFEPRVVELVEQSASLSAKAPTKRESKTRKVVGGAVVRLAHGGSSAALKSDPFRLAFIDEYVEMLGKSKKAGRVLELVETRGESYSEFTTVITSTPSMGIADVELDKASGLEFWKLNEDCECPAWALWQQGTRYHWTWPCPSCGLWFIPRSTQLRWDNYPGGSAVEAQRSAWLECPRCKGRIEDNERRWMNENGEYVAPGQVIAPDGRIEGEPTETPFLSFWVSGLASPFKTFGDRAFALRLAQETNDASAVRTALNSFFGEIWAPSGPDTPEWSEVAKCVTGLDGPYPLVHFHGVIADEVGLPPGLTFLTCAVDVQKWGLVYVIRGWGARATSWMVGYGILNGDTSQWEIWEDLADLLMTPVAGKRIRLTLVDSGFRPDKADAGPESVVYEFCRRYERLVRPAKGASNRLDQPMIARRIEIAYNNRSDKYGLELIRIDTDWAKSWVHQHVRWPKDQDGAWFLGEGTEEGYFRQIVSEARVRKSDGKAGFTWIRRSKQNHYLDCEAMNFIAGWILRAHRLRPVGRVAPEPSEVGIDQPERTNPTYVPSMIESPDVPVIQTAIDRGAPPPRRRVIASPFIGR